MIRTLTLFFAASLAAGVPSALAQSKLQQQFSHVDLGIQAVGEFNRSISGPVTIPAPVVAQQQQITLAPSNTVGALVTLRYTPRPYLGAEFNGGYSPTPKTSTCRRRQSRPRPMSSASAT